MSKHLFRKSYRFTISGLIVTGLHIIVALILIDIFFIGPAVANGIAFIIANLLSYIMNTLWSFSSTPKTNNLFKFFAVSAVGGFLAISVSGIAQYYGLHYLLGIVFVVIIVPPTTFILHNFWTYR